MNFNDIFKKNVEDKILDESLTEIEENLSEASYSDNLDYLRQIYGFNASFSSGKDDEEYEKKFARRAREDQYLFNRDYNQRAADDRYLFNKRANDDTYEFNRDYYRRSENDRYNRDNKLRNSENEILRINDLKRRQMVWDAEARRDSRRVSDNYIFDEYNKKNRANRYYDAETDRNVKRVSDEYEDSRFNIKLDQKRMEMGLEREFRERSQQFEHDLQKDTQQQIDDFKMAMEKLHDKLERHKIKVKDEFDRDKLADENEIQDKKLEVDHFYRMQKLSDDFELQSNKDLRNYSAQCKKLDTEIQKARIDYYKNRTTEYAKRYIAYIREKNNYAKEIDKDIVALATLNARMEAGNARINEKQAERQAQKIQNDFNTHIENSVLETRAREKLWDHINTYIKDYNNNNLNNQKDERVRNIMKEYNDIANMEYAKLRSVILSLDSGTSNIATYYKENADALVYLRNWDSFANTYPKNLKGSNNIALPGNEKYVKELLENGRNPIIVSEDIAELDKNITDYETKLIFGEGLGYLDIINLDEYSDGLTKTVVNKNYNPNRAKVDAVTGTPLDNKGKEITNTTKLTASANASAGHASAATQNWLKAKTPEEKQRTKVTMNTTQNTATLANRALKIHGAGTTLEEGSLDNQIKSMQNQIQRGRDAINKKVDRLHKMQELNKAQEENENNSLSINQ